MTGFFAFFETLKAIIEGVKFLAKFIEDNRKEAWWSDWTEAREKLKSAKTPEERMDAARRIRESISGM